jgi:hypothetical protein
MTRRQRESGQSFYGPDSNAGRLVHGFAQPSPQAPREDPLARASASRLSRGSLQTLWSTWLPLRQRGRPRAQALSLSQHHRTAASADLCVQGRPRRGRRVPRQLPQAARGAQRDLRHQHRTPAPPRGSRVSRHGAGASPGHRRSRLRQGGRHPRQHGRLVSCRRRPAIRSGGAR